MRQYEEWEHSEFKLKDTHLPQGAEFKAPNTNIYNFFIILFVNGQNKFIICKIGK